MTAIEISCICVAGAGFLIVLISLPFFFRKMALKKNCTAKTVGTVIKHRISGGDNGRSVAPVVEYQVDGKKYKAYRHYRGVVSVKTIKPKLSELFGQNDDFYISDKDKFYIRTTGIYHDY